MKNIIKKVMAYIMTIYGSMFTVIVGYQILADELYATDRLEGVIMMTCLPAMVIGFRSLKKIWVNDALSKERKIIRVTTEDEESEAA